MAFETYNKEKEKIAKEELPEDEREPEKEETLAEIMADKEESHLFGLMLEEDKDANKDMAARFAAGKLNPEDFADLEIQRKAFTEKMDNAENISKELTSESVMEMGRQDPKLQEIINISGPEKMLSAVKAELAEVAIKDPARFDKLSKSVEIMQSFEKGRLKDLDDSVKEYCKKEKIDSKDYEKIAAIKDTAEGKKAFSELIRKSWGTGTLASIARGLDTLSFKTISSLGHEAREKHQSDIEHELAWLDKCKKDIGAALAESIKGNDSMREALSREIIGSPVKKEPVGFKETKGTMPTEDQFNKDVDAEWPKYKNDQKLDWVKLTEPEKEKHRDGFMKKMSSKNEEKLKGKRGFWATIILAILGERFEAKKKDLN
jgi:hypothetical protein